MATKEEVIEIKRVKMETFEVEIEGVTPLIIHAWSEKAKREMLEAQQGKSKVKVKAKRNPVYDFIQSMYWIEGKPDVTNEDSEEACIKAFEKAIKKGARFGFPATGFKQAANSSAYRQGWVKNQMGLRGAYFIETDNYEGLVEIKADTPIMREDMVRIGNGSADLRYRGEFRNWTATLKIIFNSNCGFTKQQIVDIIEAGGMYCGVGEWRPEKDGQFGMYRIKA